MAMNPSNGKGHRPTYTTAKFRSGWEKAFGKAKEEEGPGQAGEEEPGAVEKKVVDSDEQEAQGGLEE